MRTLREENRENSWLHRRPFVYLQGKLIIKVMKYSRFDRHEVFEMSDTSFVLDCIKHCDKYGELGNMLYGLFDGFLYDEIYNLAVKELPIEMYLDLENLLLKVHESLAA